jgi:4-amino-4-deoxy-L-arabinose transferase-like glycosyltransferase
MSELVIIILFSILTFVTRIVNLLKIPIFTDEAIYIRWAQIGLQDPAQRYISLTDGKQPLLTWLMYPALKIFNDPLYAGRFISVISGVFTVVGIYLLAKKIFDRKTAVCAMILYIASPFTLVYDRLALMDSLLSAFGIWSLYLEYLQVKKLRLDIALILGTVVGFGLLTKSSALYFLVFIPISLFLIEYKDKKILFKKLFKFCCLSFLSGLIAEIIYNSLRLSPWFYIIKLKNYSFIMTFDELIKSQLKLFIPNLNGLIPILVGYLTYPIFIIVLIGVIYGFIKKDKNIFYLFLWFFIPFFSFALFAKVIFPRFILFMIIPLFIISGLIISKITYFSFRKVKLGIIVAILVLAYPIFLSLQLIFTPIEAKIPIIDRNQLFDDWPSGYGVREVIEYIRNKSTNSKVIIGTEGTFGLNPASIEIYLENNSNVEILGFWPVSEVPQKLIEASYKYPTYIMFKDTQQIPANWPLTLISKFRRGKGNTYLLFYRVDPSKISK